MLNYLDYFEKVKQKLETTLQITLQPEIDFCYSGSNFISKYKGIFENNELANESKQSIARYRLKDAKNANFAFLLCEQICAIDIDLSQSNIAKGVTLNDVVEELNKKLLQEGVKESELISLTSDYNILSKRGCHIYFLAKDSRLTQKRTIKLKVKDELITIDWLARRLGQAQADFAFFTPPKDILEVSDEAYESCYYRKPLGDDFNKIKIPSNELVNALASIFKVSFKERVKLVENSIFKETSLLSDNQIKQSKLLSKLYKDFVSLNIPEKPIVEVLNILTKHLDLFESLSSRLGGNPSLLDHIKALQEGNRLNSTSNNSMAHFINGYLADASANIDTPEARENFNKFVESLFVLLQVSNANIKHFESSIETYHIPKVYESQDNKSKRAAYNSQSLLTSVANSSYSEANADFVNRTLLQLDNYTTDFIETGAPVPFYDKTTDKYAFWDGSTIDYVGLQNFKTLFETLHGKKIGSKEGQVPLHSIPRITPIFEPNVSELFFAKKIDESSRIISKKAHEVCLNLYNPSKARLRFFDPLESIAFYPETLDAFISKLQELAPYTYHLLANLTGHDNKAIAVVCSTLARHLESPSAHQQALVFQDLGGTGKSTFVDAVKKLFGSDGVNITSDSVGSKFLRSSFESQLVTHCEDISASVLVSKEFTSFLKTYVGNPTLRLEAKNTNQISIPNYNLMIITTNYTGAFATENGSVNRRLSIINAAHKSQPLKEVELWKDDFEEARNHFFFEFSSSFVDVLAYSLSFLNRKEYTQQYLSANFEALTEDSVSRISGNEVVDSIKKVLGSKESDTTQDIDGELKNTIELHKMKIAFAIEAFHPLDGSFKAEAFLTLLDSLRQQRNCMLSNQSLKYAFGKLGTQLFNILENTAGLNTKYHTSCLSVDPKDGEIKRKASYKAILFWAKQKGEILPNGLSSNLDEIEIPL